MGLPLAIPLLGGMGWGKFLFGLFGTAMSASMIHQSVRMMRPKGGHQRDILNALMSKPRGNAEDIRMGIRSQQEYRRTIDAMESFGRSTYERQEPYSLGAVESEGLRAQLGALIDQSSNARIAETAYAGGEDPSSMLAKLGMY